MGIEKEEWREWAVDYRTKEFIKLLREEANNSAGLRSMTDFAAYKFADGVKEGLEAAAFSAENAGGADEDTKANG